MKKFIYFILGAVLVVIVSITLFMFNINYKKAEKRLAIHVYNKTLIEFNTLLEKEKKFLLSLSQSLAKNPITIKSYTTNEPNLIANSFASFYKTFYENNLLTEMHFFKYPVINFVNFEKDKVKIDQSNLIAARKDILLTVNNTKPGIYFFVCRHFPGLRSVSIIKNHKTVLGSVSLGINLEDFIKTFRKIDAGASIYLNDDLLKTNLSPSYYTKYKKYPLYANYRVIGDNFKIDFTDKFEIKKDSVLVIIPIKDVFEKNMAYVVIKKDLSSPLLMLKHHLIHTLVFEIIIYILAFLVLAGIFNKMEKHYNSLKEIVTLVKNRKFDELEEFKEKDRATLLKNELIHQLKEIAKEIELLRKEIQIYKRKAYRDNVTQLYNLNFLEDHAIDIEKNKCLRFILIHLKRLDPDNLIVTEISHKLKEILRKDDIFIRYSEKEFLILLPKTTMEDAQKVKEKITNTIQNLKVYAANEILKIEFEAIVGELKEEESIFEAINRIRPNK